ncbi:hypothetical protein AVEN_1284-1 [Araneus ventricosus]|uniref:Uncharacterized protein n=1 Tax=Araneus ventricosus TaxID=182803 RepID=A0A4Y2S6M9_ARAVE|nr:hypothetical protein AVEN_1284-1 [Araneus ventricosus]
MQVTTQRISSQRKLPWKGSHHSIQHPRASSKRNFVPFPPNPGKLNGTTVTLRGMSNSSSQRSRLPQHRGNDQKSCLQRDMAHSQLTLRYLASGPLISVVMASWELLCTLQAAAALPTHIILPSPQTTLKISGGKETSTTHCQEFK